MRTWHGKFRFTDKKDKNIHTAHCQYHGDAGSKDIVSHVIDLFIQEYHGLSSESDHLPYLIATMWCLFISLDEKSGVIAGVSLC